MSREDLAAKLDTLNAIKKSDVASPKNIPVAYYLQEAENLFHRASEDLEALTSVGLDENFVTDLPARAGALREAESQWSTTRFAHQEAEKEWLEKSPDAFDLRNDLLKSLRFAFRKNSNLLNRVAEIAEGYSNADMIQDLNDISVLGKDNADLLSAINFDMNKLDEAAQTADEMADLLGLSTSEDDTSDEIKIRNRAYTHLKQAVDEVYDSGQYAFRNDDSKSSGYTSAYLRRLRVRLANKKEEEEAKGEA